LHWFNQLGVAMTRNFALVLGSLLTVGCVSTTTTVRDVGKTETGLELGAPLPGPPVYDARVTPTEQGFQVAVWRTLTCRLIRVTDTRRELVRDRQPSPGAEVGVAALTAAAVVFLGDDGLTVGKRAARVLEEQTGTDTSELPSEQTIETVRLVPCFTKPAIDAELIVQLAHVELEGTTDEEGSALFDADEGFPTRILVNGRSARLHRRIDRSVRARARPRSGGLPGSAE